MARQDFANIASAQDEEADDDSNENVQEDETCKFD